MQKSSLKTYGINKDIQIGGCPDWDKKTDSRSFSEESFLYVYHQFDGHNTLTAFVAAEHLTNHQKYP